MSNQIYLAAPFFSPKQKEHVRTVQNLLAKNPTLDAKNIFIPMEHQMESEEFGSFRWQTGVFNSDMRQVHRATAVVAILDYKLDTDGINQPDSGTIFEIGAAFDANIPVIMVQFAHDQELNLMLSRSYTAFFNGKNEIKQLETYNFNDLPTIFSDVKVF